MTTYDPTLHRTEVSAQGQVPARFYAVNKLLMDMDAAGIIDLVVQAETPSVGDQANIWLDISDPESGNGAPKIYSGGVWTTLTPQLFFEWMAGESTSDVTTSGTQTLTNKTIDLGGNTITGTITQFNAALTGADFATLAGSETLSNKTLTAPTLTTPALGTPTSGILSNCTGLPVAGGGTGASTAANARTNLGLVIGADVQAYSANLAAWSALATAAKQDALGYTPANAAGGTWGGTNDIKFAHRAGTGAGHWLRSSSPSDSCFIGLDSTDGNVFRLYSALAVANCFTLNLTTKVWDFLATPTVSGSTVYHAGNLMQSAPASGGASGTAGQIAYDSSYIYVCTATNTWKRAALSTW